MTPGGGRTNALNPFRTRVPCLPFPKGCNRRSLSNGSDFAYIQLARGVPPVDVYRRLGALLPLAMRPLPVDDRYSDERQRPGGYAGDFDCVVRNLIAPVLRTPSPCLPIRRPARGRALSSPTCDTCRLFLIFDPKIKSNLMMYPTIFSRYPRNPGPLTSWASISDPCAGWIGVGCDPSGASVISLSLYGGLVFPGVSATLPPELCALSSLTLLSLSGQSFSGTAPACLGQLSLLTALDLSATAVSGTLPSSLYGLAALTELAIYSTSISGTWQTQRKCISNHSRSSLSSPSQAQRSFPFLLPPSPPSQSAS